MSMTPRTGALLLTIWMASPLRADDTVINTPVAAAQLRGVWELQTADEKQFKQQLRLGGAVGGSWHRSQETLPITLAWFIEGGELRLLHYYEPNKSFNYRVKTLMYRYKVDGDDLELVNDEGTSIWKRIKRHPPPRP